MIIPLFRFLEAASWLAATGLLLAAVGCGKTAESGTVDVKGIVTLDGKPVDKASVAFIGKEGARLATAQTDGAGKFTIRAAEGKNVVTVAKASANPAPAPAPSDGPSLMPTQGEYQVMLEKVKNDFPSKYGDPKTSGISFDISEKTKDVEVVLSSK
jgi:hypothetical protein